MIEVFGKYYVLQTRSTSYIMAEERGYMRHIHYGEKVRAEDAPALDMPRFVPAVNSLCLEEDKSFPFDSLMFEYSFPHGGDSRPHAACMGENSFFGVESIEKGAELPPSDMPLPHGWSDVLKVTLSGRFKIELYYLVFEDADVIVRFARAVGGGESVVTRFDSMQLDLPAGEYEAVLFTGAWSREFTPERHSANRLSAGSYSGMSSAECNPFFMVEGMGRAYGFNLMYSGSHGIRIERGQMGLTRVLSGMQSENLRLRAGESLCTPCAVLTCAADEDGVSRNMHAFITAHVVEGRQVPVMLNTWEAMYFDLNEEKLLNLARLAAQTGFECLVVDDGWFSARRDDTTSLGDWYENRELFPRGIKHIVKTLNSLGMKLGVWIEPEMISKKSRLWQTHPDWALDGKAVGRNQFILDLTKKEVSEFVLERLLYLTDDLGAEYIKMDFNRRFADIPGNEGSGYFYRYYAALYSVLHAFRAMRPGVVLENCASGGGRFDLGMLSYSDVSWASDNTDPLSRAEIQQGASFGYPPCVTLAHVGNSPAHQTRRISSLTSRIHTALTGAFGVQTDISRLSAEERGQIAAAIEEYKHIRGKYPLVYRLETPDNFIALQLASDRGEGLFYLMQKRLYTSLVLPPFRLKGLDKDEVYEVRGCGISVRAGGAALTGGGLVLPQSFHGDKLEKGMTDLSDCGTLLLHIGIADKAE